MKRILYILFFVFFLSHASCQKYDIEAQFTITNFGKVINSENGMPIQGVVVSDGYSSGITDSTGTYSFTGSENARFIFYSIPEMYEVPLKDGLPAFYKRINTNTDSIKTNFELTPLKNGVENKFTLFCVADPQVGNAQHISRLNNETVVDLKKENQTYSNVYGITLGDLVADTPELMEELKQAFVSTEIPFFHTIGNHDDFESYEETFGPVDYSFNRGKVHIVVMNNSNEGRFTREQINWLKSDLQHVPKNKMLIVCLHVPIANNNELLDIIKPFKEVHVMTGHYHQHNNKWHSDYNIYEHITGAASGLWWSGITNKCGAPNGYAVYEIDGNSMKNWYYKSVNYPRNFQIRMYAPNSFGDTEGFVVANVWNVDKDWTIELMENGIITGVMEQFTDYDPGTYAFLKASGLIEPGNKNSPHQYSKTSHLFRLKPMGKNTQISIKATDRFGNVYFQNKFIKSSEEFRKY